MDDSMGHLKDAMFGFKALGEAARLGRALAAAAARGDGEGARAALRAGADPEWRDEVRWTPLLHASQNGHADCVRALIDAGADPDGASAEGCSALSRAAAYVHPECVALLLLAGADPELGERGHRPLELAINHARGAGRCVELLARRSNLSHVADGSTALERALKAGVGPCAEALMAASGADPLECAAIARGARREDLASKIEAEHARRVARELGVVAAEGKASFGMRI